MGLTNQDYFEGCLVCCGLVALFFGLRHRQARQHSELSKPKSVKASLINSPLFWIADVSWGSPYDVDQERLAELQFPKTRDPKAHLQKPATMSLRDAHDTLTRALTRPLSGEQEKARRRLQEAFRVSGRCILPDLFLKAVPDLDTVLFDGDLRGRISIRWAQPGRLEDPHLMGLCKPALSAAGKQRIELMKEMYFTDTKERIWSTLVHEMLHAYLDIKTARGWRGWGDEHHGEDFERSADRLGRSLGFDGFSGEDIASY